MDLQALAQLGCIMMLQPEVGGSRDNSSFAGVDKVRFRKPLVPGDTLIMRMTLTKVQKRFGIVKMEGKAYVGSDLVCEGEFLLAMWRGILASYVKGNSWWLPGQSKYGRIIDFFSYVKNNSSMAYVLQ
jgi:hypothetical protein